MHVRPVSPLHTDRYDGDEVFPPQYPTLASRRPFPFPNSLRYRCSTPQKHPAANVAFSPMVLALRAAESDNENNGKLVEKGRVKRENKVEPNADAAKLIRMLCTYTESGVVVMVDTTEVRSMYACIISSGGERRHI